MRKLITTVILIGLMISSLAVVGNAMPLTATRATETATNQKVQPLEKEQNGIFIDTHAVKTIFWDNEINLSFDWVLLDSTGNTELYRKHISKDVIDPKNSFIKLNATVKPGTKYKLKYDNVQGAVVKINLSVLGKTFPGDTIKYKLENGKPVDIYTTKLESDEEPGVMKYQGTREFPLIPTYSSDENSVIVRVTTTNKFLGDPVFYGDKIKIQNVETKEIHEITLSTTGVGSFIVNKDNARNYFMKPLNYKVIESPKGFNNSQKEYATIMLSTGYLNLILY